MEVGTQLLCDNPTRRDAVIASPTMNGIDYLEVVDDWAKTSPDSPRQRTLIVHLFKVPTVTLDATNVTITGGVRVPVGVQWAYRYGAFPAGTLAADEQAMLDALPDRARVFVVRTTVSGDFSTYQLALVRSSNANAIDPRPPLTFDLKLSTVDLLFKVECPSDFDCATAAVCPPVVAAEPDIDYLAKDWSSFRRLMLDRMSAIMPEWTERHPADVGNAIVEVLAYAADHLSYYQDAVATEAYLGTARTRVSVRRHARLLDYNINDGANARAWIALTWRGTAPITLPRGAAKLFTRMPGLPVVVRTPNAAIVAIGGGATCFEPLVDVALDRGLNQIALYTWGDAACCLPAGATIATLDNTGNQLAALRPGAVIIFGEVLSPTTALPEDADPTHRQAVRLVTVTANTDPLYLEPDGVTPQRLVEVTWAPADALTFPLCVSRIQPIATDHTGRVTLSKPPQMPTVIRIDAIDTTGASPTFRATAISWSNEGGVVGSFTSGVPTAANTIADPNDPTSGLTATLVPPFDVAETFAFGPASIAWGNVVLADHGMTQPAETLPVVTSTVYRPRLANGPVTQAPTYAANGAAVTAFTWEPSDVAPAISIVFPQEPGVVWTPRADLLEASAFDHFFVVETEDDSSTYLRFGDGTLGRVPDPTLLDSQGVPVPADQPLATYRVGNGVAGNIGGEAIGHAIFDPAIGTAFDQLVRVRNPIAAAGGTDPETIDQVKVNAPQAFRVQERAVTVDDYATIAERHPEVVKAAATRRWTGSWYTIYLSVDRSGGLPIDAAFSADLRAFLETYRLAAQDLEIEQPQFVPLEISLAVCVDSRYYRADVRSALLAAFSNRMLSDGSLGFFYPDNYTFGQPVYLSRILAAAMAVPGVKWVDPSPGSSVFRRFWASPTDTSDLMNGQITMARLEVVRLDNDPNFPEYGTLDFAMTGGM